MGSQAEWGKSQTRVVEGKPPIGQGGWATSLNLVLRSIQTHNLPAMPGMDKILRQLVDGFSPYS